MQNIFYRSSSFLRGFSYLIWWTLDLSEQQKNFKDGQTIKELSSFITSGIPLWTAGVFDMHETVFEGTSKSSKTNWKKYLWK